MSTRALLALLTTLTVACLIGGCATYKTVTYRSPQVVAFEQTPPISSVAKVYYRTYEWSDVDSGQWVDGGLVVFSEGERLRKLRYDEIDSVLTQDKRVFTLLPKCVASVDSVYYDNDKIDRVWFHRWIDGRLETASTGRACMERHRYSTWDVDSLTVTYRRANVIGTALTLLGTAACLFAISLF